jgi:hypothetical protein
MPIHDWTRVEPDVFHAFRHRWLGALCDALNAGALPEDHLALVEPVRASDRIAIRHRDGRLVAIVEILGPRDKADEASVLGFVEATGQMIHRRVHVLIVDLFPPGPNDPRGIHNAVWDALEAEDLELPADRPLVAASYDSGPLPTTYIEPMAVGDALPEMPIFLEPYSYVPAPLEAGYQAAWDTFPAALRGRLEPSIRPDPA